MTDNVPVNNHVEIIHRALSIVNPGITKESYQILKSFDTKPTFTKHSVKIRVYDMDTKIKKFTACVKLKGLNEENVFKKVIFYC